MIKKRLVELVPQAKKHILSTVLWQWGTLAAQIVIVSLLAFWMECAVSGAISTKVLVQTFPVLCIAGVFRFVCDRQSVRSSYRASADVKLTLRKKIYEKLLRIGAGYQSEIATSAVVQMAAEGVEQLEVYFGKYLPQFFYSLLAPVTLFVVLSFVSLRASLVLLVCVPLIPASIVIVQKYAKKLLKKYWGAYSELGDSFLENLQGLTTLKIYQADEYKAGEMDREAEHFRRITMKVLMMQLNSTSIMDILAYGGAAVGMILAVTEFMSGTIGLAQTLILILLASEFFIPLRLLGSFFHIAMNGMAASDRIFELLELPEDRQGLEKLQGKTLDVIFDHVSFSYDGEREILKGVSLKLPAGIFVSLVGESGCGKSTIAAILMGRNKGYHGSVKICGRELEEYQEADIMKNITLVSSSSYIFKGTVAENLRMGREDVSREEMQKALQRVNLWDYLNDRQGLETPVMDRGDNFSGGQRQRLALARAILHDSPVYIFDEATSNIDAESEEMIMDVIRQLAESKTVLLMSHRLANVTESDCIYMMKKGQIVEMGTHRELMEHEGEYCRLYKAQKELEEYGRDKNEA